MQTNALNYNQSNGVAIRSTGSTAATISIGDQNVTLSYLQVKNSDGSSNDLGITTASGATSGVLVDSCIIVATGTAAFIAGSTAVTFKNCVLSLTGAGSALVAALNSRSGATTTLYGCTVASPSDATTKRPTCSRGRQPPSPPRTAPFSRTTRARR